MKTMKMLLLGMDPKITQQEEESLMKEVDFCIVSNGKPYPIGTIIDCPVGVIKVTRVERDGRIAVVETVNE